LNNSIEPALYIVSTPIGNLEDISFRAVKILKNVDIIACEDTRTSGRLLKELDIQYRKLVSYHEHNELEQSKRLIDDVLQGKSIALISDAGTPLISDPGYRIVNLAVQHGIKVIPVPGASSFLAALSASGFSTNRFTFAGFAPQKKGRMTFLKDILAIENTVILFESTHRIEKLINELHEIAGPKRKVCIAREITKLYEEFIYGDLEEVKKIIADKKVLKGEIVVILEEFKKD